VERQSPRNRLIIALRHGRVRGVVILFGGLFFFLPASGLRAQQDDPSDIFLKAYLSAQQGEKLEHESRFKTALTKYRFAGSLIEELRKSHPDWQPAIVEYRGRKISEGILRVEERMSRQNDLTTGATRLPDVPPSPPDSGAWSEPGPEVVAPQAAKLTAQPSDDAPITEATKKLRSRVDQLQGALDKARSDLETAQKEKDLVSTRLKETASKLEKAQKEIEKSKKSEGQVRDQLTQFQESLKALQSSRDSSAKEEQQLRAEVAHLKDAVAAAEEARVTAERQRDETNAKFAEANKQFGTLVQERDGALVQLKGMKEAEQQVQMLLAENSNLKQRLTNAEKTVRDLGENAPKQAGELAKAKQELAQLQQQLTEAQRLNQYLQAKAAELSVQLDEAGSEVQNAKLIDANSEESLQLAKENELLRNIIVRERQEEARRYQAKKLIVAELEKLKTKSDALNKQIEFLSQPVTKLTTEELALLRQPVVSISDQNPGTLKASFVFAKKSSSESAKIGESDPKEKSFPDNGARPAMASPENPKPTGDIKPDVPDDLQSVARAAKESFERGKYLAAEEQYRQILIKSPNNSYALSNLGAVYLCIGNLQLAESMLKKALSVSAKDAFAHTTLGIVYYRQSNYDDASAELSQAIEINPKSATAHNYLGVTASQKGRQREAEKEILQAIANDPDYADAHFNLAVILATTHPASKELAKRHYARATALGAQPNPSLERLLQ
jgi:tetratricopeptide (TPR) repeat protein